MRSFETSTRARRKPDLRAESAAWMFLQQRVGGRSVNIRCPDYPFPRRNGLGGDVFGADTLAAEVVEIADAATPQSLQIARNRIQARNPCVVVCFRLCRRWFARWPLPRHQTCPAGANGFGAGDVPKKQGNGLGPINIGPLGRTVGFEALKSFQAL